MGQIDTLKLHIKIFLKSKVKFSCVEFGLIVENL